MPVLKLNRPTIQITLPDSGAVVELWETALAGDLLGGLSLEANSKTPKMPSPIEMVVSLIAKWDFVDEQNQPIPVEMSTVKLLSLNDFTAIALKVKDITEGISIDKDVKKNINNSST